MASPLHGINARACSGAEHQRHLQSQALPRPAGDPAAVAAAFTQQLNASLLKGIGTVDGGGGEDESSGAGSGFGLGTAGGLDAAGALGNLGALASPNSLGSMLGMPGGLGSLASMPGLGMLAGIGGVAGGGAGANGALQAKLITTLIQALGSVSMLAEKAGDTALSTPTVTAGAGASLVQPAPASASARENAQTVAAVARKLGVPEDLAVAMMLVESSGNGRAVGDGGTSFGLFQLHKGGMLTAAGLTPEQAFDPRTNATVALRSLAGELRKGGGRSLGEIAADSQRPADKVGYAQKVHANLERARSLVNGPSGSA